MEITRKIIILITLFAALSAGCAYNKKSLLEYDYPATPATPQEDYTPYLYPYYYPDTYPTYPYPPYMIYPPYYFYPPYPFLHP